MRVISMSDLDLSGKRVFIRQDLNVPIKDGKVLSEKRLHASLPTLKQALAAQPAALLVTSHLGRPTEGAFSEEDSLAPVAARLEELLGTKVNLVRDWIDRDPATVGVPGEITLLENCRMLVGEKANSEELGKKMAAFCDVYVMDAFATAHRAQASTHAAARFAPVACAGPLLAFELESLTKGLEDPKRPLVAIVGGAKVSTKLTVLSNLAEKVDSLILGGGIVNTFLAARGMPMGASLHEPDLVDEARRIMEACDTPLPTDVRVGSSTEAASATVKPVAEVADGDMILDVGPDTAQAYAAVVAKAGTVVWNGPLGLFENPAFAEGTRTVVQAIASSDCFSVLGGGETVAALEGFGLEDKVSYVSTGGGAFLEFLEGKTLPAVAVLEERAKE